MEASEFDPRYEQLRPGLWETVQERYPGCLFEGRDPIPLARIGVPLEEARVAFISSAGVQPKGSLPFDVVHPVGDFSFRRVPSDARREDLEIHQLKYPTDGAAKDLNVVFPLEHLRALVEERAIGALTPHVWSFIGYTMDPFRLESELAESIADDVVSVGADLALLAPA